MTPAHRDLERQLAEGASRQGHLVARAGAARRLLLQRPSSPTRTRRATPPRGGYGSHTWRGAMERSRLASRCGLGACHELGQPLRPAATPEVGGGRAAPEARISPHLWQDPNCLRVRAEGRTVGSPFYAAKLTWFARLARWLAGAQIRRTAGARRRSQRRPADADVWNQRPVTAEPRLPARARRVRDPLPLGARRRLSTASTRAWRYTGGTTAPATSTRTSASHRSPAGDAAAAGRTCGRRSIARHARATHPLRPSAAGVDVDQRAPFEAGWASAEGRIAARRTGPR